MRFGHGGVLQGFLSSCGGCVRTCPRRGLAIAGFGDDVAVGVEGDRLACVAGLLGDLGWGHASFEGEADPAVPEVVGGVAGCAVVFAGLPDRPSECAVAGVGEQASCGDPLWVCWRLFGVVAVFGVVVLVFSYSVAGGVVG